MDNLEMATIFCEHDPEDPPCPDCIRKAFLIVRKLKEDGWQPPAK